MYSPKEVRKLLNVSAPTLARYGNLFTAFLSQGATVKGRKRNYTEGDINTLQQIRELYQRNFSTAEIEKALSGGAIADRPPLSLIPAGLTDAFSKIDDKLGDHDKDLAAIKQYYKDLAEWDRLGFWEKRRTPKPRPPE